MSPAAPTQTAPIEPLDLAAIVEEKFLDYSMSVITDRALPDARDGLKPVHRRILWGMHRDGVRPDRPYVKCAKVVGSVMGAYHPHGDAGIYDALVRLAQPHSLAVPLIDPHGNFGSPDDPAAASRYTECRLAAVSTWLLDAIDEDTVDLIPNYDGTDEEPVVLPARFPNLLVNGLEGIAVGLATKIPPHNLSEVLAAAEHLLDHPDATTDELAAHLGGPDFPTGGLIMGDDGYLEAYRSGRGRVKLRARTEIEEGKRGAKRIVATELPYQVGVDKISEQARTAVEAGTITGIRAIRNESAGGRIRLVFELRADANDQVILANLFKHTDLQVTYGMNLVALDRGVPRTMTLRDLLTAWVGHQVEVITRRSRYRLNRAEARLHLLEGLLKALDMIDAIIATIRASADRAEARAALMAAPYEFTEAQAVHILDLTLGRLTRLGRTELEAEAEELRTTIRELRRILDSRDALNEVVRTDLAAIRADHGHERRTTVTDDTGEINTDELIVETDLHVVRTGRNYLRAVPTSSRAAKVPTVGDDDLVVDFFTLTTVQSVLVFTDAGQVHKVRGADLPDKLTAIPNLTQLTSGHQIVAVHPETLENPGGAATDLLFVLASGQVKRSPVRAFTELAFRRDGAAATKVPEGDRVVAVLPVTADAEVLLISAGGQSIRFPVAECREMGRTAVGVRGINLSEGDRVVDAVVLTAGTETIVFATSAGALKRTRAEEFPLQSRGGKGTRAFPLRDRHGRVCAAASAVEPYQVGIAHDGNGYTVLRSAEVTLKPRDGATEPKHGPAAGLVVLPTLPEA